MNPLGQGRRTINSKGPALVLVLSVGLIACSEPEDDRGPGEMTVGEARALDDAASMLDEQRLPENSIDEDDPLEPVTPAAPQDSAP